jgi:hypothetical protein
MASTEVILTINDVEEVLSALQEKYKISSSDFSSNAHTREAVPEDDAYQWSAYLDHRNALQELDQELHRAYIQKVMAAGGDDAVQKAQLNSKLALAA